MHVTCRRSTLLLHRQRQCSVHCLCSSAVSGPQCATAQGQLRLLLCLVSNICQELAAVLHAPWQCHQCLTIGLCILCLWKLYKAATKAIDSNRGPVQAFKSQMTLWLLLQTIVHQYALLVGLLIGTAGPNYNGAGAGVLHRPSSTSAGVCLQSPTQQV